ncbi:LamG-like jellyroll fold domain-containing protein [Streptomyces xanthochromogenes]|uniref:LamG-like jellyroll fold domain-containing protein n=1 Tax=Streptomyces xanthochromogenes TaxID=67384 RepID=UPI003429FCDF
MAAVSSLALSGGQAPAVAADAPLPDGRPTSSSKDPGQGDTPETLAVAEARQTGKDVSIGSLLTETSEVSAQPDGTLVETMHTKVVRTRKNGSWQDINTSLHTAPDGSVAPAATLAELKFSGGGSQPLVTMAKAGKGLKLSWPSPLPAPVIDGNTAEYRSVLPDVDLRMTATASGFTQLIVVKTAEAAKNPALDQLKLGLSSDDLTVRHNSDGTLAAVDNGAGGTVFEAAKPMMFDSTPGLLDGSVASAGATTSTARQMALKTPVLANSAGDPSEHMATVDVAVPTDQTSLVLTPNQQLLDAPGTVFPVMIDPNLDTPHAGNWAGMSRYWGGNSYWKFDGDFGTGFCGADARCAPADVKRVLYSIPVRGREFVGKTILSAKLNAYETHSFSCTPTPVELYATSRISPSTTWDNSSAVGPSSFWTQRLQTVNAAFGYTNCAAGYAEFGGTTSNALRDKVQQAANGNWVDMTLGLKAASETDPNGWKRFTGDASLQVTYNLPPRQVPMKDLTMSPGGACTTSSKAITKLPQLTAKVTDPDGEKIGVQFAAAWTVNNSYQRRWWSTGSSEGIVPSSSSFKASGSLFSLTLPTSVPINTLVGWEVRGWDGKAWGPWSSTGDAPTDCYFRVDTTAPAGPVISSSDVPGAVTSQADLPWTDGVGRYGTFTLTSSAGDVVKYQYGLDQDPSTAQEVPTTGGAARSVKLLMAKEGPHRVMARALDAAGNVSSETTTYFFNVRGGQSQRTGWAMDGTPGATSFPAEGSNFPAKLAGGAAAKAPGHSQGAISLPGAATGEGAPADYAATDGPVLDTERSFTVSAWVNVTDLGKDQAAVSQSGQHQGLALGLYSGRWTLKMPTADAMSGFGWSTATSNVAPIANQWTHLAGVYDATAKTLTLYVNGKASTPTTGVALWAARDVLNFGRLKWLDKYTDAWHGSLDDVRVWDRTLSAVDVTAVSAGTPLTGLGAKARWTLDDDGPSMRGGADTEDLAVTGGVQAGVTGTDGAANTAARFDGTTGYVQTADPQVNGTGSFSVSAWVRMSALPTGDAKVVINQAGVHNSEFSLYYSVWQEKWVFGRYQSDAADAALTTAVQSDCAGSTCAASDPQEWTHLVGVSDTVAHKLRLYVDGYLAGQTDYTQTTPWAKPGALRIGAVSREGAAGQFFGGDIDDVRVFDRVLTTDEAVDMVQQRPQLAGRWRFNTAAAGSSPDDLLSHPAVLAPGSIIDTANGGIGTAALTLNGTSGYASTQQVPLDTTQSFSVAGWVQTAGVPDRNMTVLALGNGTANAVTVRWQYLSPGEGQWQVESVDASAPTPVHSRAVHTFAAPQEYGSRWNHLAVTYDAFTNQLVLYVNGQLQYEPCDVSAPAGTCVDHISATTAKQPLKATWGLQFGRNATTGALDLLSGQIDDVWAYRGVLSPAQINVLASGTEYDSGATES